MDCAEAAGRRLAAVLTAAGWSGRDGTAYEVPGSVTATGRVLARAALRSR